MNKLRIAVEKARCSPYNEEAKADYKRFSLGVLRSIAKDLQLAKNDYSIRFNPGGIAVSGEATLHHNNFYLQISWSGVMFRTCKGQKDYSSGANQWAIFAGYPQMDVPQLVNHLKRMISLAALQNT